MNVLDECPHSRYPCSQEHSHSLHDVFLLATFRPAQFDSFRSAGLTTNSVDGNLRVLQTTARAGESETVAPSARTTQLSDTNIIRGSRSA